MPASSESTVLSGNPVLDVIDGGARWVGAITFNRVDPSDPAETGHFVSVLPSAYQTASLGLTEPMWDLVSQSLAIMQRYAAFTYSVSNGLDANYFVSDFRRPDNLDVAGIAGGPGEAPVLAFNRATWDDYYTGQVQQWIVLHELGHTLGLTHATGIPSGLDHSVFTVMSYNWEDFADAETGEIGLPLTPMALDVAVLQAKYGAAVANTGATTYRLGASQDLDGADGTVQNGHGYICIWDSAGFDEIAYDGSSGVLLNLNTATLRTTAFAADLADVIGDVARSSRIYAGLDDYAQDEITDVVQAAGGFFSSLLIDGGFAIGGYTIAQGAQIEAARGGGGDDLIIGNQLANLLQGNGGQDDLFGGWGADTLDGGAGDDVVWGGLGDDSISDTGGGANYLRGEEGNDSVVGGSGFDDINGNMGADTASGGLGEDWVVGGKDNDVLSGGDAFDIVYGNLGSDTIAGDAGDDIVRGGQQDDVLFGGAGDDYVSGDRDNDTITGGAGADTFHSFAEAGLDRVLDFNRAEGDRVLLDAGTTYTVAEVGADTVITMSAGQVVLVGVSMSSLTGSWITVG